MADLTLAHSAKTLPTDATGTNTSAFFDPVPELFGTASAVVYDGGNTVTATNHSDDNWALGVRLMSGATVLAAADAAGSYQTLIASTATWPQTIPTTAFAYVNTTADRAAWSQVTLEFQAVWSKNKGGDGSYLTVEFGSFTVTHSTTTPQAVGDTVAQPQATGQVTISGAYNLSLNSAGQAHSAGAATVGVQYNATPGGLSSQQSIAAPAITFTPRLTPGAIGGAQSAGSPALTQHYVMAPDPGTQGHRVAQGGASPPAQIAPIETAHLSALDPTAIAADYSVQVDKAAQAGVIDQSTILALYSLAASELSVSQTIEPTVAAARYALSPAAAAHPQWLSPGSLIDINLSANDITHAPGFQAPTIFLGGVIGGLALSSDQGLSPPALFQHHLIAPAGIIAPQPIDSPVITQHHLAALNSLGHAQALGSTVAAAIFSLVPAPIGANQGLAGASLAWMYELEPGVVTQVPSLAQPEVDAGLNTAAVSHQPALGPATLIDINLAVEMVFNTLSTGVASIVPRYAVSTSDIVVPQSTDLAALTQHYKLTPFGAAQPHRLLEPGLTQNYVVSVESLSSPAFIAEPLLSQLFTLFPAAVTHVVRLSDGNLDFLVGVEAYSGNLVVYTALDGTFVASAELSGTPSLGPLVSGAMQGGAKMTGTITLSEILSGTITRR